MLVINTILKKKSNDQEQNDQLLEGSRSMSFKRSKTTSFKLAPTIYPPGVNNFRVMLHSVVEGTESTSSKVVMWSILSLIIISIICFIFETMPEFHDTPPVVWQSVEMISTITFTIEYFLRLWVSDVYTGQTAPEWIRQPMNICDLLAIIPFYIMVLLESADVKGLRVLRAIRLMRVFRLFKLGRYSSGLEVMTTAMMKSFSALSILLFLFLIGLVLFSSSVYFTEKLFCPDFLDITAQGFQDFYQYSVECEGNAVSENFGICCAYECRGLPKPLLDNISLCVYKGDDDGSQDRRLTGLQYGFQSWGAEKIDRPKEMQISSSISYDFSGAGSDSGDLSIFQRPTSEATERMLQVANTSGRILIDYNALDWEVLPMHSTGFPSIIVGFWWTCVTMTTVGYGDLTPAHWVSKVVASMAMLTGILLIALPVSIVGVKLHESIQMVEEAGIQEANEAAAASKQSNAQAAGGLAALVKALPPKEPPVSSTIQSLRDALEDSLKVKKELNALAEERDDVLTSIEYAIAQLCHECLVSQTHLVEPGKEYDPLLYLTGDDEEVQGPKHCQKSLYFFDLDSKGRQAAIRIVESTAFDRFILLLIVLNSVLLANEDFYDPKAFANTLSAELEIYFTVAFTGEFLVKIVAMGFFVDQNSYLRDAWNWLDFIVVVSGLVTLAFETIGGGFKANWLRTFRVLRPLRSLSALPGVRALVDTVLLSLPRLANVCFLGIFLFVTFGILGINFWGGTMHRRCRLTPQPLHFTKSAADPGCKGWCFDDVSAVSVGGGLVNSSAVFNMFCGSDEECQKAFSKGEDYYIWPLDNEQERFCGGGYSCGELESPPYSDATVAKETLAPLGVHFSSEGSQHTWCGNPLADDLSYGPASVNAQLEDINLNNWWEEVNHEAFFWGITHFDTLACAVLVIFQCITMEGWVDIMYLLQDAHGNEFAAVYFSLLIVLGSFFLLNITLAIVWEAFSAIEADRAEKEEEEAEAEQGMMGVGGVRIENAKGGTLEFSFSGAKPSNPRRSITSVLQDQAEGNIIVTTARKLANHEGFNSFIMVIIVLNIVTLAMDSYPPPGRVIQEFLAVTNLIFTIIFGIEFLVFNIALGPFRYWTNYMYGFDGVIVISSFFELIMNTISDEGGGGAISALRGFRLLRIFKLAKKWHSFRLLLKAIITTVMQMGNFVLLLTLMIIVFSLMGMSFFGGYFYFDDEGKAIDPSLMGTEICPKNPNSKPDCVPRAHFDTFLWGFITIFQILSGENWNTTMYDGMKARGWPFLWYFVGVVVMGNFVILNLFLAILMTNFEETSNRIREVEAAKQEATRQRQGKAEKEKTQIVNVLIRGPTRGDLDEEEEAQPAVTGGWGVLGNLEEAKNPKGADEAADDSEPVSNPNNSAVTEARDGGFPDQESEGSEEIHGIWTYSLFIFPPGSCIRESLFVLVKNSKFDMIILSCIIISSLMMAFSNPLNDPKSQMETVLSYCNIGFTILFFLEMMLKIIAMGLIIGPETYLRNSWNILDMLVVAVSVMDLATTMLPGAGGVGGGAENLRTLRMLRALRPLRLISRNENLKLVVNTLFKSIPELCNLLIVTVLFLLIFGLMGVNFFKGSLYSCVDVELEGFEFEYQGIDAIPVCTSGSGAPADPFFIHPYQPGPVTPCNYVNNETQQFTRPTRDTPVCEVRCNSDSDAHAFCKETSPWGYHIMKCTDCQTHFCPEKTAEEIEDCRATCDHHQFFCKTKDKGCMDDCMASCACDRYCNPLAEDAALCLEQGGRWVYMNQNFDNIAISILSLFEISTTEGWVDLMYAGVDARGGMLQPERDYQELFSVFFVAFILIGSFFMLNLCVGVIIDNFNKMRSDKKGSILMTDSQASWVQAQRTIWNKKQFFALTNLHELSIWRRKLFFFVVSPPFENSIMFCICLNTVSMAMQVVPTPSKAYGTSLMVLNMCFTLVFNLEAVLKLSAMRLSYFKEQWNCFDFSCVISTDVGIVIDLLGYGVGLGTVMSAIRLFRIARLFRLIRFMKGLNQLFTAFLLSIPKLANVTAILILLLFLFAVLGVNLFSKVLFHSAHDEYANFRSFFVAVMTLIRSMTGEAWNEMMHALSKDKFYFESYLDMRCAESTDYDTMVAEGVLDNPNECGNPLSFFFFLTYTLLVTFVILNLFIAVIFEGFDESQKSEQSEIIQKCVEVWKRYDPNYTLLLSIDATFEFIDEVISQLHRDPAEHLNTRPVGGPGGQGQGSWQKYDLYYMRVIQLRVTPQNEVRFVRAILAVLRRIACMGGLEEKLSKCDRIERLKELEWLEREDAQENVDMVKIRDLESKRMKAWGNHYGFSSKRKAKHVEVEEEIPLEQVVAASKIQIMFQELLIRKRGNKKRIAQAYVSPRLEEKSPREEEIQRSAG